MDTGGTLTEVRKTTIKANGYFQWRMLPPLTVPKESHGGWGGGGSSENYSSTFYSNEINIPNM